MDMIESICVSCTHLRLEQGAEEDGSPPEYWCEEESDNFRTEDGCWMYEEERG